MKIASTQYTLQNNVFEIYISGCNGIPKCIGCHNKELWDFDVGEEYTLKYFTKLQQKTKRFENLIDNIMILGGEPLDQNIDEFYHFIIDMKSFNKNLWLFTRYKLEEINKNIIPYFNYIKCGRYCEDLTCDNNTQYGIKLSTSNQKIYKKGIDY
jgi:anaerobic ribonucleoside-triphosphate reductase activating protein